MRTVTEHVFPRFYPALLGHMPPENYLLQPPFLPQNWENMARNAVFPYLSDMVRAKPGDTVRPLEARLRNR
jgi:hypothetical protein